MRAKKTTKFISILLATGIFILSCCFCGCGHTHTLEHVQGVASTCTKNGVVEHWHCSSCGKNYADSNAQSPLESVVASKANHRFLSSYNFDDKSHFQRCIDCGYKDENAVKEHVLKYSADQTKHYQYCYCGYRSAAEPHVFNGIGTPCELCRYGALLYELSADNRYYVCIGVSESYKTYIDEIEIPDVFDGLPVMEIGERAFAYCENLTKVTFGGNIISVGASAFYACTNLKEVTFNQGLKELKAQAFLDCTALEEVVLPSSVTILENAIFKGCTSLSSVDLGTGVDKLRSQTFYECASLKSVDISNVRTFQGYAIFAKSGLTELVVAYGITEIPQTMCWSCKDLTAVTIPSSVTSISMGAFQDCTGLQTITYLGTPEQWYHIAFGTYPSWQQGAGDYQLIFAG